jgi:hypothetical protein
VIAAVAAASSVLPALRATMSARKRPALSAAPRITEPQPRMPAATAPCSASGAAAYVIRLACTDGTRPCSAIATSVASSTRRCAGDGTSPLSRNQTYSVKPTCPMSSWHRSLPRTTMVSAVDVDSDEFRNS